MIMTRTKFRFQGMRIQNGRKGHAAKPTALIALALIMGIATILVPRYQTVDAATELSTGPAGGNAGIFCPFDTDFINNPDEPTSWEVRRSIDAEGVQPEILGTVVMPGTQMDLVWLADMTVGMAQDADVTYTGYIPGASGGDDFEGSLNNVSFVHDGVEYTILGLFQQQVDNSIRQLVLNSDVALPDDLTFEAGDDRFALAKAVNFGANGNIHTWPLGEDLNWSEGQVMPVSLMEPSEQPTTPFPICH